MQTNLLDKVLWRFSTEKITDKEKFSRQVQQYQKDIRMTDEEWIPDKEVLEQAKVFLLYEAWIKGIEELLPNEELAEQEDFTEENAEDGYFQVEILALLEADNKYSFTMLELLMKVHNQQYNKELGDHSFFEGLEKINTYKNLSVYYVNCGS